MFLCKGKEKKTAMNRWACIAIGPDCIVTRPVCIATGSVCIAIGPVCIAIGPVAQHFAMQ